MLSWLAVEFLFDFAPAEVVATISLLAGAVPIVFASVYRVVPEIRGTSGTVSVVVGAASVWVRGGFYVGRSSGS